MRKYFDERSIYEEKRRGMRYLFLVVMASAILVIGGVWHYAHAQKVKEGQVVNATTVLCHEASEATLALKALHDGGKEAVQAYVSQDNNSCDIGQYTFIVGPTVGASMKDDTGTEWTVLTVHPPPDPSQTDYTLARVAALDLASY